jgi:hypothetical protein
MKGKAMSKNFQISITGQGHEFQHHRLKTKTLQKLLKSYDKDGIDVVIETYFDGGKKFDEVVFGGEYGCDAAATIKIDGKAIKGYQKTEELVLYC